jgi:hypothetical protein
MIVLEEENFQNEYGVLVNDPDTVKILDEV